jgi:hypothetical protein
VKRDGHEAPAVAEPSQQVAAPEIEIAPNDPILAYLASVSGVVEVEKLDLDSPVMAVAKHVPPRNRRPGA